MPRCYFAVDNDLYSMPVLDVDNTEEAEAGTEGYEGKEPFIWRHNVIEQPRNLFYNTPFKSSLTIVANYNPSMVKAFNAISIESNYNGWSGTPLRQTFLVLSRGWTMIIKRQPCPLSTTKKRRGLLL